MPVRRERAGQLLLAAVAVGASLPAVLWLAREGKLAKALTYAAATVTLLVGLPQLSKLLAGR